MLPGPNTLAVGRRTDAGMSGGVTLTQTPGGHVPAATQGSGGGGPPPPPPPGPAPEALQASSRHCAKATAALRTRPDGGTSAWYRVHHSLTLSTAPADRNAHAIRAATSARVA